MARLYIPEDDLISIMKLISLGNKNHKALINVLQDAPTGIWGDKLAALISEKTGIELIDAKEISRLLYTLSLNKRITEISNEEFLNNLVLEIKESKDEAFEIENSIIEFLKQLLSIESINFTAKAIELELEREKAVIDTRIITDLRPIFDDKNPNDIKSFLIVHNLKVKYKDYSNRYECYFSVDEEDLARLKDQVIRALDKSKRIKQGVGDIDIIKLEN